MSGHADESRRSFDRGALSALGDHGAALKEFEEVLRNVPDYLDDDPELRPFIVASRQAVKG